MGRAASHLDEAGLPDHAEFVAAAPPFDESAVAVEAADPRASAAGLLIGDRPPAGGPRCVSETTGATADSSAATSCTT